MLDGVSIASPCSANWDDMPGTDQVRHCAQCDKNVYNLSAMTRRQAEALLRETEGHLCARLYRRADGTILTENCPVGLRNLGRRISRVAGAAMSAMLTISSSTAAHLPLFQIAQEQAEKAAILGEVWDFATAPVAGAVVEVTQVSSKKKFVARADYRGQFHIGSLEPGGYTIQIASPGFRTFVTQVALGTKDYEFTATMQISALMGDVVEIKPRKKH